MPSDRESQKSDEESVEEEFNPEQTNQTAFTNLSKYTTRSIMSDSNSSVNGGHGVFSLADLKIADLEPEELESIQRIRELQRIQQSLLN